MYVPYYQEKVWEPEYIDAEQKENNVSMPVEAYRKTSRRRKIRGSRPHDAPPQDPNLFCRPVLVAL